MQDEGRKSGVADKAQETTFNPEAALNAAHKRNADASVDTNEPERLDAEREAAIKAAEQKANPGAQKDDASARTTKNGQNASPDGQSKTKDGHEVAREEYEAKRSGQEQSRGGLLGAMDALGARMAAKIEGQGQGPVLAETKEAGQVAAPRPARDAQGKAQSLGENYAPSQAPSAMSNLRDAVKGAVSGMGAKEQAPNGVEAQARGGQSQNVSPQAGQSQGGLGGMNAAAMAEALAATKGAVSKMQERGDTVSVGKPGQQQARPGAAISGDKAAEKQQSQGAARQ